VRSVCPHFRSDAPAPHGVRPSRDDHAIRPRDHGTEFPIRYLELPHMTALARPVPLHAPDLRGRLLAEKEAADGAAEVCHG